MKRFWLANNKQLHYTVVTWTVFIRRISSGLFSTSFIVKGLLLLSILLSGSNIIYAQKNAIEKQIEYEKTVTERVTKIVNTLEITDSDKYHKVLSVIVNQYFQLNTIHDESKTAAEEIKAQSLNKEQTDASLKAQEEKKATKLLQQHAVYIALLKEYLTEAQIEKVKDGMTYRVFPITYAAYQDMLPGLTDEQTKKIYNWLKEAREFAMDAESSEKKHAAFGKYKGKINNYLSAAGYDMKKEGEEWQKRIKEREGKVKVQ